MNFMTLRSGVKHGVCLAPLLAIISAMRAQWKKLHRFIKRADAALAYLSGFELGSLNREQENLLKLCLSLAEIGPAVEWYGAPEVSDGYDPKLVPLVIEVPENFSQ